jgi:hypothetical protein
MNVSLMAALVCALWLPARSQQTFAPDAQGFIRNWLVVAPFTFDGESGAAELDREFLPGEAELRPKAGDTVRVGVRQRTWSPHETADYFIDFYESFGQNGGEYAVGYAVAYVIADEQMTVTLAMGSNDQAKVWLNGQEVVKAPDGRGLVMDSDKRDVTLARGQNVLIFRSSTTPTTGRAASGS